jgi:hypothetical protein
MDGIDLSADARAEHPAASGGIRMRWELFQTTRRLAARADEAAYDLRSSLVDRYGDLTSEKEAAELWGHDPQYALLGPANAESDAMSWAETDRIDELLAYPADSVADLAVKLAAVLYVWRQIRSLETEAEYHETLAMAFLNDAEKVLRSSVPPIEEAAS